MSTYVGSLVTTYRAQLARSLRSVRHNITRTGLGAAVFPLLVLVAVGTLAYAWIEQWSLLDALYATIITITTVGYGDFSPQTFAGRIFAIFFTLSAIGLAGYAISTMAALVIEKQTTRAQHIVRERRMKQIAELEGHIIVCGANVLGHRVTNEFFRRQTPFVLLEQDEEALKWALLWMNEDYVDKRRRQFIHLHDVDFAEEEQKSVAELAEEMGVLYIQEDPTDEQQLRRAGLAKARGLVAALNDDRDNMAVVLSARDMANRLGNPDLRIIARVHNEWNTRRIYLAGADKVVSANFVGGFQMATHMLNPVVGEFWDDMLYKNEQLVRFVDMHLDGRSEWIGRTVDALRQQGSRMVVAIKREGSYLYAPEPDVTFAPDDILIVIAATVDAD